MQIIKNINNNVSICLDNSGKEVVVLGKGIGFLKPPYDLPIEKIQRTFYDIDPIYINMLQEIPAEMIELSALIVDYARRQVEYLFNSSIVFTLADHLTFAIKRFRQKMVISMPIYYDVKSLYEKEYEIGRYALKLIKNKFDLLLPDDEIIGVALHFINASAMVENKEDEKEGKKVIKHIKNMVEDYFNMTINEDDFNYSRFVTHLQYLLKRGEQGESISSENDKLYKAMVEKYPETFECAKKINTYLYKIYGFTFNEEELLYLMLHVNRLCIREDCYR